MVNSPLPQVLALPAPAASRRNWVTAGTALGIGTAALALIFRAEIAAAFHIWMVSAAFNYCFLVIPVAAYLAWDRRDAILATEPHPMPWLLVLAIPAAALWLAAERLGVMEGRQLMAMTLLQVMFAAVIGWRAWRVLAIPLLYLYFAVPAGEFLVPYLQWLSVHFATATLTLIGVPNFSNGGIVEIPQATFFVGPNCSGFGFLLSSTAFGVLFATLIYRSPVRWIFFVLFAAAVPIVANGLRVGGTIALGTFVSAKVIELDHTSWGWYFFSLILLIQMVVGLPFRQDRRGSVPAAPTGSTPIGSVAVAATVTAIIMLAAIPPLVAAQLAARGAGNQAATHIDWPVVAGCVSAPSHDTATAGLPEDDQGIVEAVDYRCGREQFLLALHRYPARASAHPLFALQHAAIDSVDALATRTVRAGNGPQAPIWTMTLTAMTEKEGGGHRVAAATLWIDGRPTPGGMRARIDQAWASVGRSPVPPVIAVVTRPAGPAASSMQEMQGFVARLPQLTNVVNRWLVSSR
jgi:exosortase